MVEVSLVEQNKTLHLTKASFANERGRWKQL